jgi:hypothetical protein
MLGRTSCAKADNDVTKKTKVSNDGTLALTLTLSLGEREQLRAALEALDVAPASPLLEEVLDNRIRSHRPSAANIPSPSGRG